MATFVPLVVLAFAIGLYPKPLFEILAVPVNNLVATVRPDYPGVTKPVLAEQPQTQAASEDRSSLFAVRSSPEADSKSMVKNSADADKRLSSGETRIANGEQRAQHSAARQPNGQRAQ